MAASVTLPPSLRWRLATLRRRARFLRALRGLGGLLLALGLFAAAVLFADHWLDFSALTRQALFSAWVGMGVVLLLGGVALPVCRRIETSALAAVIEQKYPQLGERLTSAVELAEHSVDGHGSHALIALLLEEAAMQSAPLDFRPALPARRAGLWFGLAMLSELLLAIPIFLWPEESRALAQRFFAPWSIAATDMPNIAEAAEQPITPVELAADSPLITVTPPAYARAVRDEESFHGLVDLSPWQHSEIRFDFRFTRPAVAAYLEWITPSRSDNGEQVTRHPLDLDADRQTASLTLPATGDGKYRLILEAERGIRTALPGGSVRVQLDQPPTVRKFVGKETTQAVLPYEGIPLEIEAADDIAVAGVELEYRINDEQTVRQPLELQGADTPSAVGRTKLELAGKVKEGDQLRYRFRVRDNLPAKYAGPHVIFYPAERWLTLQVLRGDDPRKQQEILAQRDEINRRLETLRQSLLQEKRSVYKVQQETRDKAEWSAEERDDAQQLQRDNRANQKALREVAAVAEKEPALSAVAEQARDVADREMQASQQALEQVPGQSTTTERTRQFRKADEQLASALKRLEEMKKTNEQLAQERLDGARLEMLADREKRLAEQAADLASRHPVLDPKAKELSTKLKREQAEAAAKLEQMTEQSKPLRQALEKARAEQARQLAKRARQLALAQRELARAEIATQRQLGPSERRRPLVHDAHAQAAQQQEQQRSLQHETDELRKQFQQLAQQARTSPIKSALEGAANSSQQAREAMQQAREQGQRGQSTAQQQAEEQAAQALERAARAAEASRQFAQASAKAESPHSGEAVAQAQQQMAAAQGKLNQGQNAQAQSAMQQASQALAQAARQMAARSRQPGPLAQARQTAGQGRAPGDLPDLRAYGLDKTPYAGKSWGELPGELRTRIVQDMKARYGEDYARMIQDYFKQIASTPKTESP